MKFFHNGTRFIGERTDLGRLVKGELSESCNGQWKVFSVEYAADGKTLTKKEYLRMENI